MKAQNKKALSALTPKALNLKVIPFEKDNSMKNNTVNATNNQTSDISGIIYEAKRVANIVNECSRAIKAIGIVIEKDTIDKSEENDSLPDFIVGGLGKAIGLLADKLSDEKDNLFSALRGGV